MKTKMKRDIFSDFDEDGLFVFVPAIMSVGLVFSIITLVRDALRWTGSRAHRRHIAVAAHYVVDDLLDVDDRFDPRPPRALSAAVVGAAIATMAVVAVVAVGDDFAKSFDQPITNWLVDIGWIDHLGIFDPFGSTLVTVGLVALIGMSGFRCRVMALTYPAAFVLSWLTVEVLQHTVQRARPSGYDGLESFPSGHMVQVVFIAGLLPLALGVLFTDRRLVRVSRVLLTAALMATGVFRIHLAKHWPLDVLGGVGIGATIVLFVHWTLEHRGWHRACTSCPWSDSAEATPWSRGIVSLHPTTTRRIGIAGIVAATACAIGLAVGTLAIGIPADPEGTGFGSAISTPAQLGLAALMAFAGLCAVKWKGVAAFMMAVSAVGLGIFASIEYVPQIAFGLTAILLIPAILTWLGWQPTTSLGQIAALAVLTTTALVGTGLGVREVHAYYYGPTHPASVAKGLDSDAEWLWLGGVTDSAAIVTAGGLVPNTVGQLHLWPASGSSTSRLITAPISEYGVAIFRMNALTSDTTYRYSVSNNPVTEGALDGLSADAEFATFGAGPQDLVVAIGSCARNESNGAVFDTIMAEEPDLYLAVGDLHYSNLEARDPSTHLAAYGRSLTQPGQAQLFSTVPTAYVWDDHDYGPNDGNSTSPSRTAVAQAYRAAVPNYGVDPNADASIAQAFTIGRVRFIITDTRSHRTDSTMLGSAQLSWFLDEVTRSSRTHAAIVWANPTPWIGEPTNGGDTWASYSDERRTVANALAKAQVENLVMVSGDAHMVAIDNGENSDYAVDGGAGFPVLHAGALDRPASTKGGPYSEGAFAGSGQYGVLTINDDGGDEVEVELSGARWDGDTLVSMSITFVASHLD